MFDQISAFFTIEMIYSWLSFGVLPFWFVLIFFPQSRISGLLATSIFPFIVLSAIYSYLFYDFFISGYNFLDNFKLYLGLDNLRELFVDSSFLIIFWIHFIAINLFCGSWIVKDSQKFFISKTLVFFPLIITYFIGPLGIFIYWLIRIFFAKKIVLFD